ncbi:MAG: peptidoglycan-binding domain-containing protein [Acidobacteriota bacterium]
MADINSRATASNRETETSDYSSETDVKQIDREINISGSIEIDSNTESLASIIVDSGSATKNEILFVANNLKYSLASSLQATQSQNKGEEELQQEIDLILNGQEPSKNFVINREKAEQGFAEVKNENKPFNKKNSDSIKELQRALNFLGYGTQAYGKYDDTTKAAVKAFQEERRLSPADGELNKTTIETLYSEVVKRAKTWDKKEVTNFVTTMDKKGQIEKGNVIEIKGKFVKEQVASFLLLAYNPDPVSAYNINKGIVSNYQKRNPNAAKISFNMSPAGIFAMSAEESGYGKATGNLFGFLSKKSDTGDFAEALVERFPHMFDGSVPVATSDQFIEAIQSRKSGYLWEAHHSKIDPKTKQSIIDAEPYIRILKGHVAEDHFGYFDTIFNSLRNNQEKDLGGVKVKNLDQLRAILLNRNSPDYDKVVNALTIGYRDNYLKEKF